MMAQKKIVAGNTSEIEHMLFAHAKTLDYVFYDALRQLVASDMINQVEVFANIAFRAQNQSRKALLALAELKNPRRATFIKQQNNAIHQQVNHLENSEQFANELLGAKDHEQWLDNRTPCTAIKADPPMETVERINWRKDG